MTNLKSILRRQISLLGFLGVLSIWQLAGIFKLLPKFILPTPFEILQAFIRDREFLWHHSWATLRVALLGLVLGVLIACLMAVLMDSLTWLQILWHFKIPVSLPYFYAGLRVSVSYAFITTVVSEWLGGFEGLGVYMIQSKKLFQYDTMFAIIILVSIISLLGMKLVDVSEKYVIKWKRS